jgi:hypothetical protein
MPRKTSVLIFDDNVVGTTAVYTSPEFNDLLGQYERGAFQVVGDQATSGATVTVQQEHSADQRNWSNRNGSPEVNGAALSTSITTNTSGYELGTGTGHGYVRLRIQLAGTTPQAHIKIWYTGRDLV